MALLDAMVSAFYTGCISGIIAIHENGNFKKTHDEPLKTHIELVNRCKKDQATYRKILEKAKENESW